MIIIILSIFLKKLHFIHTKKFLVLLLNRLEVTKTLKLAYDDLNMRKYDSALLYFAEMAEIGIESAQANFIYMLDRKMFSKSKFNVSNLMRLREKYMLACSANLNKFLLHLLGDELLTGKGIISKHFIMNTLGIDLSKKNIFLLFLRSIGSFFFIGRIQKCLNFNQVRIFWQEFVYSLHPVIHQLAGLAKSWRITKWLNLRQ